MKWLIKNQVLAGGSWGWSIKIFLISAPYTHQTTTNQPPAVLLVSDKINIKFLRYELKEALQNESLLIFFS